MGGGSDAYRCPPPLPTSLLQLCSFCRVAEDRGRRWAGWVACHTATGKGQAALRTEMLRPGAATAHDIPKIRGACSGLVTLSTFEIFYLG